MNVRSLQFTRIVLRIPECQHLDGIRYGGRYVTHFSAPKQSNTISTLPASVGWILLMLSNIKWMAISPRSSPQYAFAMIKDSENDPTTLPRPLLHSRTNAAEHRFGNSSLM